MRLERREGGRSCRSIDVFFHGLIAKQTKTPAKQTHTHTRTKTHTNTHTPHTHTHTEPQTHAPTHRPPHTNIHAHAYTHKQSPAMTQLAFSGLLRRSCVSWLPSIQADCVDLIKRDITVSVDHALSSHVHVRDFKPGPVHCCFPSIHSSD